MKSEFSCKYRCWEGSLDRTYESIERKLTEEEGTFYNFFIEFYLFTEDSECNREIIEGSFFSQIGRGKVDCDACPSRESISRILHSTPYALAGFLYCCISESHNRELSHTGYDIYLNLYEVARYTIDRR